ncbi:MAG: VOC family protein [Bosea sp. (in: a-proteobacteria)]
MKMLLGLALALGLAATGSIANAQDMNMRGIDHVGITVPDLEQATIFFTDIMGCQAAYKLGPFKATGTPWMTENIDADAGAELVIQTLRCGNGSNVELFGFKTQRPARTAPLRDELGATSIGFYVDDLPAAVARMKAKGVAVLGDIKVVNEGPIAGESWVYTKTSWGLYVFLLTAPNGTANDRTGTVKLWSPRG